MVDAITWVNLLPGLGMIAVGIGAMALWYFFKGTKLRYFGYGAILWAIAIIPKVIMDFTITQPIQAMLFDTFSVIVVVLIMSLYVGLRTGLFESGFTYLVVKHTKLSGINFDEAVALGIGFGGAEAIIIGLTSLLGMMTLMSQPDLAASIPPEQLAISFIPIPILERLFTLFCHVFATVLVVYAVKLSDLRLLWLSVAFKTALDGALPILEYFVGRDMSGIYITETYVTALGIIALVGMFVLANKYSGGVPDAHKVRDTDTGH